MTDAKPTKRAKRTRPAPVPAPRSTAPAPARFGARPGGATR